MNIINERRTELSGTPYLNNAIDGITARVNHVFRQEHTDEGTHTAITAESVAVAGDVDVTEGDLSITSDSNDASRVDLSLENTNADGQTRARLVDDGGGFAELALFNSGSAVDSSPQAPYMFRMRHASTAAGLFVLQNTWNNGIALYVASGEMFKVDSTAAYERGRSVGIGVWAPIAFNAANYTGDAAAWTVIAANQVSLTQRRVGTSCKVNFSIQGTNVTAGSTQLRIAVPTALVAGGRFSNACARAIDAGVPRTARVVIDATVSTTFIFISRTDAEPAPAWTATAGSNTTVEGQIEYESAS